MAYQRLRALFLHSQLWTLKVMPGRKPRNLKLVSGTLRPGRDRAELEFPAIDGVPEAPDFLDVEGAKEFERVARILTGARVLSDADLGLLAAYAAHWSGL